MSAFILFLFLLAADEPKEVVFDGITFVYIPAGVFMMGTSDEDRSVLIEGGVWTKVDEAEYPARRVAISRPFYLSKYEITQKQWKEIMGSNPSVFQGDDLPVESLTWHDVQEFVGRLNAKSGARYRLPTEAEWEYACRAGSPFLFATGQGNEFLHLENLGEFAWYRVNDENRTHPAGQKRPNAWGLHDMHGNVWEWCQDSYDPGYYKRAPAVDPHHDGPLTERVFRGGSWFLGPAHLRAAFRGFNLATFRSPYVGFRLVREP